MTLGWVVRAVNMWASLGGGPVCILVIEFSFTKKLARIPGGGATRSVGQLQEKGGQSLEGPSRVQLGCCEWPSSGCPAGFPWSTVGHGVLGGHH